MTSELESVTLGAWRQSPVGTLTELARQRPTTTVDGALELAILLGSRGRHPGSGHTRDLWEALATVAARDLGAARAIEPHLDALAILDQAERSEFPEWRDRAEGHSADERAWGVFAAEGGDGPLAAVQGPAGWTVTGTKPWCSLADRLDAALVSAHTAGGARRLFAVRLAHEGVRVIGDSWHARGLTEIPSGPVRFDAVPAVPIGESNWYLERPGFAWGGIGVAACWFGGAVGLARSLFAASAGREPGPFLLMHLGAVDVLLQSARRALLEASDLVDGGRAMSDEGRILAKRVRATVAQSCEEILSRVGHALGPAPLAQDPEHAKRVADLEIYVRQHHAERDLASAGASLRRESTAPW
jgi:alkylation response protein AidB-like acyl-CoA dehydrogenase